MIHVNELRVGNLVNYDGKITAITGHSIWSFDIFSVHIQPIPLTPEILEKCGFHNEDKGLGEDYWKLKRRLCKEGWSEKFTLYLPYFNLSTYTGNVYLKPLHQLQNLYFALTGQELEINLI